MNPLTTLVWFRRNLRLADNTVLQAAVQQGLPVVGVVVCPQPSEIANQRQAVFMRRSAAALSPALVAHNVPLYLIRGHAETEIPALVQHIHAASVWADEGYTPSEILSDNRIWRQLDAMGIPFARCNDRTVFAKAEIADEYGQPYRTFAPYRQAWLQRYAAQFDGWRPSEHAAFAPVQTAWSGLLPPLPDWVSSGDGQSMAVPLGGEAVAWAQWDKFSAELNVYPLLKDFPSRKATSQLSVYLSAGCLSARMLAQRAHAAGAQAWLDNLIRRDFACQRAFHTQTDGAEHLPAADTWFVQRWQQGRTGFPLIDAAMRCLRDSGWLHPALRTLVAEFWCRTLAQPWQAGAAWFAEQQTDNDEALNRANWQQAAAQIQTANPVVRSQQLDPDATFIRRYVPELAHLPQDFVHTPWLAGSDADTHGYPPPLVPPR
ncbi:deoxyribodipyrimidine photo-lyase [Neisseria perflava]|uniref:FAD-binding domain-containing protein n=1 Tax=Neisseria perflava TaxID=33053 RepID=UPI0020A09832|nr:deoxyribodipyrimidine photo-lyase [Neisseria perflava]MCP1772002.1 deoxyribodipyrimidine photo-lyase [Neisseria perflava]